MAVHRGGARQQRRFELRHEQATLVKIEGLQALICRTSSFPVALANPGTWRQ